MQGAPAPLTPRLTPARLAATGAVWLATFLVTAAAAPYLHRVNFVVFWIAVLFAAWHAGFLAGLLTAVLSVAAVHYLFDPSGPKAWGVGLEDLLVLGIFLVASGLVGALAARRSEAHQRADRAEQSLRAANLELEEQNSLLAEQQGVLEHQIESGQTLAQELEAANEQLQQAVTDAAVANQRVLAVLNSLSDSVAAYDPEWHIQFLNQTARDSIRELGMDPDAVMGQVVWDAFPFLRGTRFETDTRRAAGTGQVVEYEEFLAETGKWYENRIIPAADGSVTTYSRDITARHDALAALRQNEARYRALVEASTLMVWHTTPEGLVEDMPFWRELTGQSPDEVRGNGWARAIHSDDQSRVADTWWRAFQRGEAYQAQYRLRLRDGSYRWYQARGVPVRGSDGQVSEWVGVFNDVDVERRTATARALLDGASKLLERADEVGETMQRMARLAVTPPPASGGVPADAFADGVSIHLLRGDRLECVSVESRDTVRRELGIALEQAYPATLDAVAGAGRVVATGRSELVVSFDPGRIARDQEHLQRLRALDIHSALVVPVRVRGVRLGAVAFVRHGPERRAPYGPEELAVAEELARRAGAALDNTARVAEAEEERARAEAASRAKSDFLASMSHELRTPLNAISGYAELIELGLHGPVTPEQLEALGRIQRAQRVLLRLINDVLNLARVEAGALEYELAAVALDGVLSEVESLVSPQVRARGLHFEAAPVPDPAPVAWADRDKVQQIVLNLLSNAVKFTEPGGTIRLAGDIRGSRVVVRVEDTGRGIPADKLQVVFEPFVQVEQGYTRSSEGTGLGLAISRDLARAMGGEITVESEVGKGSVFTLSLPRADETGPVE